MRYLRNIVAVLMLFFAMCIFLDAPTARAANESRDDSAYIQNLIDSAIPGPDGIKVVTIPSVNPNDKGGGSVYYLSNAIELSSNTTVKLDNCTLRLNDGVLCNIFVSKGCYGTTMTVDDELENISIIGIGNATLDGGNHNGVTEKTANGKNVRMNSSIHFRNVNGFKIEGITVKEPRYWGITLIFCRYGTLADIRFDCTGDTHAPNQDGIDLRHGCNNIDISNITGTTGDDTVALTTLSGERQYNVGGKNNDIHDVNITDIKASCVSGHGIVRLLCHNGNKVYNVNIKNVEDTGKNHVYGVLRVGDTAYADGGSSMAYGDMYNVSIDGVISNGKYAILAPNTNVTTAHVDYKNVTVKYDKGKITDLKTDKSEPTPFEPLSGYSYFSFVGGSTAGWTYNNNDMRTIVGTFLDKPSAYTMWPIGTDRPAGNIPLELQCEINGDTTLSSSLRLQLLLAHRSDPEPGLLKMYYSTDNGQTWSEEPIKLTIKYHSEKWYEEENYFYDVWSYTSENLSLLTDESITNIMIRPYGDSGKETVGAFRMIGFELLGEDLDTDGTPQLCTHRDANDDGKCDNCGNFFTDDCEAQHRDADDDGRCDAGGELFEDGCDAPHRDKNDDGKCDFGGEDFEDGCDALHKDTDDDGKCDFGGEDFDDGCDALHKDTDDDGKCDFGGEDFTDGCDALHKDTDDDGKCDFGGEDFEDGCDALHKDTDDDGKCDFGGEDFTDGCDALHKDTDDDGKCDVGGEDFDDGDETIKSLPAVLISVACIIGVCAAIFFIIRKRRR